MDPTLSYSNAPIAKRTFLPVAAMIFSILSGPFAVGLGVLVSLGWPDALARGSHVTFDISDTKVWLAFTTVIISAISFAIIVRFTQHLVKPDRMFVTLGIVVPIAWSISFLLLIFYLISTIE